MKTIILSPAKLLIFALMFSFTAIQGQDDRKTLDKKYKWVNDDKKETLFVEILESSSSMSLSLSADLQEGELKVDLYDPEGHKIPGFHLESDGDKEGGSSVEVSSGSGSNSSTVSTSSSGSSSSTTIGTSKGKGKGSSYAYMSSQASTSGSKGVMNKIFSDPLPGKWKLVIKVEEATGELRVNVAQD